MFTGIIQSVGVVTDVVDRKDGRGVTVNAPEFAEALAPGDSVAVNGVCHTVEGVDGTSFWMTSVGETLARTTMGRIHDGSRVNLEQAARLETALGGHMVQGHVDGVAEVVSFADSGQDRMLTLRVPVSVHEITVEKGSVSVDGVSLTVVSRLPGDLITITVIPYTVENTIFAGYREKTAVNVEADIMGKYVLEYMNRFQEGAGRR